MLKNVVADYLTSTKELQFFLPFMEVIQLQGFYDVHLLHSATEYGKDLVAKRKVDNAEIQYSFQVKAGDLGLSRLRTEVIPQLTEAVTNKLSHPNFNRLIPYHIIFVCTGVIHSSAAIAFQEFNVFVRDTLHAIPIETWEKPKLVTDFVKSGIEPFFEIHRSPEFAGRFFGIYSQISNDQILSFFDIEEYTKAWLLLDWSNSVNRLQILFEAYFYSKLLFDKERHYEASLFIASLVRVHMKNGEFGDMQDIIQEYFDQISLSYLKKVKANYKSDVPLLLDFDGTFSIFYHPLSCLRTLEIFSLYILTSAEPKEDVKSVFYKILDQQKGSHRILSDNYAVTIVLVSLTLIKLSNKELLKRYLNNVCVWLCDRYSELGLASLGADLQEEIEQLLSENLEGLSFKKNVSSFSACACLDMAYIAKDKLLFEGISNDFRAVNIVLQFYHVMIDEALFIHDHEQITTSNDEEFALEYQGLYSKMFELEMKSNSVTIREKNLFFLIFLLRDRYFPSFIHAIK